MASKCITGILFPRKFRSMSRIILVISIGLVPLYILLAQSRYSSIINTSLSKILIFFRGDSSSEIIQKETVDDLEDISSKIALLESWPNETHPVPGNSNCSTDDDTMKMAFVREFFVPKNKKLANLRNQELQRAIEGTIKNNPCGIFVFVVGREAFLSRLARLLESLSQKPTFLRLYLALGDVTYDRLLFAAKATAPSGSFVVSTGDVLIGPVENLPKICATAFNRMNPKLFVVSRHDVEGLNCTSYANLGSLDVFIGSTALITRRVLTNTVLLPTYWGIENVVGFALTHAKDGSSTGAYNLCRHVSVTHIHKEQGRGFRIRINHDQNSFLAGSWCVSKVCKFADISESVAEDNC